VKNSRGEGPSRTGEKAHTGKKGEKSYEGGIRVMAGFRKKKELGALVYKSGKKKGKRLPGTGKNEGEGRSQWGGAKKAIM